VVRPTDTTYIATFPYNTPVKSVDGVEPAYRLVRSVPARIRNLVRSGDTATMTKINLRCRCSASDS
jgi:hypothetical protein